MKIAILTFHRALNYGALLQAYALKTVLTELGNEVEVMDYRNEVLEKAYYYPSFFERKGIKNKLKYIIQGRSELKRIAGFDAFRNNELSISNKIYNQDNVAESNQHYDLFITGSDQVWNYRAHNFDANYFLDFVKDSRKKRSYAASIGLSVLPEEYKEQYKKLLMNYQIISVRESQGKEIIDSLGIHNIRLDLDPTFLLTASDWKKFCSNQQYENYIFAYYFELTPTLKEFAEKLSMQTGLKIIYVGNAFKSPFECHSMGLKTASPREFVEAINGATYVVTNSFHGTAFSINMKKPFFVELLQTDAAVNSRLINILENTGLMERQISCFKDIKEACNSKIDWRIANEYVNKQRKDSINYLMEYTK